MEQVRRPYLDSKGSGQVSTLAKVEYATRSYHLTLFFAVQQVVVVLHRYEFVPAMLLSNVLQSLKLPCCHGAGTDISNPALFDDIVQSLHDLLSRRAPVQAMNLENIDVCA